MKHLNSLSVVSLSLLLGFAASCGKKSKKTDVSASTITDVITDAENS